MNEQNSIDRENTLNLILEWGKTKILSPHIITYREDIEECCKPLLESGEDVLCDFLSMAIKECGDEVESAITILSDIELATSIEKSEDFWREAESGFDVFDETNYIMEAVHYLITKYISKGGERCKEISQQIDDVFSRITQWMEEGNFSPLRFIVLNRTRCECLARIPEDERYRFPWYEAYSDYADDTVELISEKLEDYLSGSWDMLEKEIRSEHLIEVSYELDRDNELFSVMKHKAVLHKNLLNTMSKPSSLKLLAMWYKSRLDYFLPEDAVEIGAGNVRDEIIKDVATGSSKEDSLSRMFLNAFCGPNLDEKQRLKSLCEVEKKIKNIDITRASDTNREILGTLQRWFDGKCDDSKLIKISFDTWLDMMDKKAKLMVVSKSVETLASTFVELLNKPADFLNELKEGFLASLKPPVPEPVWASDEETHDEEASETIEEKKNLITFTLKFNKEEKASIISPPDLVYNCNAPEDYKELWNDLDKTEKKYWGGCFVDESNQIETFTPQLITERTFHKIKGDGYKAAIIGLSIEEEQLKEFIGKLKEALKEGKDIPGNLNIVTLLITFERETVI